MVTLSRRQPPMTPREALSTVLRGPDVDEALAALDRAGLIVVEPPDAGPGRCWRLMVLRCDGPADSGVHLVRKGKAEHEFRHAFQGEREPGR